jgi:hypothetical protein
MEGISDGRADDACFVCGLLWPDLAPCPRCAGRLRWWPATAADDLDVLARVARGWDTWRVGRDRDTLEQLLEDLHRFAPGSLEALRSVGGDLDQLRHAWRDEAPELSPDALADRGW